MNDNIIKSIDNDIFKHDFKYLFNKVVNILPKNHCAFISQYSPSNAKNFEVSNLFYAAWHVLMKYAKEHIHNISDKPLYKTLIDLLEKCKDSFGTSINYNLLGIQDPNVIQSNSE